MNSNDRFMDGFSASSDNSSYESNSTAHGSNSDKFSSMLLTTMNDFIDQVVSSIYSYKGEFEKLGEVINNPSSTTERLSQVVHSTNRLIDNVNTIHSEDKILDQRLADDEWYRTESFFDLWFRRNSKDSKKYSDMIDEGLRSIRSGLEDLAISDILNNLSNLSGTNSSRFEQQIQTIKEIRTELGWSGAQWSKFEKKLDSNIIDPLNKQYGYIFSQQEKLDSINTLTQTGVRQDAEFQQLVPLLIKWNKVGGELSAEDLQFLRPVNEHLGTESLDYIGDVASKLSKDFGISFSDAFDSLNFEKMYNNLLLNAQGDKDKFNQAASSLMGASTLLANSFISPDHMNQFIYDLSRMSAQEIADSPLTQQLYAAGLDIRDIQTRLRDGDYLGVTNDIIQSLGTYLESNPDMARDMATALGMDQSFLEELILNKELAGENAKLIQESINNSSGALEQRLQDLPVGMTERISNWFESIPFVRDVIRLLTSLDLGIEDIYFGLGVFKMLAGGLKGLGSTKVGTLVSGVAGSITDKSSTFIKNIAGDLKTLSKRKIELDPDFIGAPSKLNSEAGSIGKYLKKMTGIGKADVGPNLPTAKDLVKTEGLSKGIKKIFGEGAESFAKEVGPNLAKGIPMLGSIIGTASSFSDVMKEGSDKKRESVGAVGDISGGVVGSTIGGAVGTMILPGVGTAIGSVLGGMLGSISGEALLEGIYDSWDKIVEFSKSTWEGVKSVWGTVCDWFNTTVWQPIADFMSPVFDFIGSIASTAWDNIKSTWSTVSQWFQNTIWTPISKVAQTAFFLILGIGSIAAEWLSAKWTEFKDNLQAVWSTVTEWFNTNIWTPITTAASAVADWISTSWNNTKTWIQDTWSTISQWFQDTIWSPVSTAVSTVASWIGTKFTEGKTIVTNAWSAVSQWFQDNVWSKVQQGIDTVKTTFEKLGSKLVDPIKSAWTDFTDTIKSKFEKLLDPINKVKDAIGNVVSKGKGVWDKITGSHRVGLNYAPFDGYRASLHEGEMILSREQMKLYREKDYSGVFSQGLTPIVQEDNTIYTLSKGDAVLTKLQTNKLLRNYRRNKDNIDTPYTENMRVDGSHRTGLNYAPFDGYVANLHEGELVVPSSMREVVKAQISDSAGVSSHNSLVGSNVAGSTIEAMNEYYKRILPTLNVSVTQSSSSSSNTSTDTSTDTGVVPTIVKNARTMKGVTYLWGGKDRSTGKLDCSGFVANAMEMSGWVDSSYKYNNNAEAIRKQSTSLSKSSVRPGDFTWLMEGGRATHIGIVTQPNSNPSNGNHMVVHSANGHKGYTENHNDSYWNYWGRFKNQPSTSTSSNSSSSNYNSGTNTNTSSGNPTGTTSQVSFIKSVEKGAIKGKTQYKVLPSLTLSQAILESGWGQSGLSTKANNLFGIKAGSSWSGDTITMRTAEYKSNGSKYYVNAKFRKYSDRNESVDDHSKLLQNSRYSKVLTATNYKQATQWVRDAGYATDPKYPSLLNNLITKHNLDSYDGVTSYSESSTNGDSANVDDPKNSAANNTTVVNVESSDSKLIEQLRGEIANLTKAYVSSNAKPTPAVDRIATRTASIYNFA